MGDLPFSIYDDTVAGRTNRAPNLPVSEAHSQNHPLHATQDSSASDAGINTIHGQSAHRESSSSARSPIASPVGPIKNSDFALPELSDQYTYAMRRGSLPAQHDAPTSTAEDDAVYEPAPRRASLDGLSRHVSSRGKPQNVFGSQSISASTLAGKSLESKAPPFRLPSMQQPPRTFSYADTDRTVIDATAKLSSPSTHTADIGDERQNLADNDSLSYTRASMSPSSIVSGHQRQQDGHEYRPDSQDRHERAHQAPGEMDIAGPHQARHVQSRGQRRRLVPMQPQLSAPSLPPLRPARAYDPLRPRWEPPFLPPVGPSSEQAPWPTKEHAVPAYASPAVGSQYAPPYQQPAVPPLAAQPPPEGPYYASPRSVMTIPLIGSPATYTPAATFSAPYDAPHSSISPPRVEKPPRSSVSSSQRHARASRARRRRHGSRHGDSMDARINSVALITPSYAPGAPLDVPGSDSQVQERPPGGYYWAVMGKLGTSDEEDEGRESSDEDASNSIMLPIQMCQPPLRDVMPAYPQALEADPQPRLRKQSKYTAQQDRLILELKSNGETWAEIAAKAHCHNQLAARNRYQVLIGQQGSGTFFWTEDDCAALQSALDEAERAKWLFLAQELSRKRGRQFSLDAVHLKVTQMFASHPETFGVIKTRDASRGGAPYRRKPLHED